ncbi:hypothetical protein BOX15_Mlig001256g2, partial [Macrostomum lignano]
LICMARKNKKGRAKRRNKAQPGREEEEKAKPHTMIFSRAGVGKFVKQLATDLRLAFEPYTAMRLRFSKSNVLKDAVAIAGKFAVSHLVYFTHPSDSINMRIVACPHGPTLTFRVLSYCLRADVLSAARRINSSASIYQHPPLLIMNGFTGEGRQLRLLTTTFRSLLPSLNLQQLNLRTVRRCLLLNYDPETDQIQLRHYSVRLAPRGVSKAVRRLRRKKVPDLSRYTDFNDFVNGAGCASDSGLSDADFDGDHNTIDCLPVGVGPANPQGGASAVRLTELGPRIELQLLKVEEGVNSGAVLYHKFVMKTPEQLVELDSRARRKRRLKAKRRSDQADRVTAKAEERLRHKRRCLEGMVAAGQLSAEEADRLLKEEAKGDGEGEGESAAGANGDDAAAPPKKKTRLSSSGLAKSSAAGKDKKTVRAKALAKKSPAGKAKAKSGIKKKSTKLTARKKSAGVRKAGRARK